MILVFEEPVFQSYEVPPEAVSVTGSPAQVEAGPVITALGALLIVTVCVVTSSQPAALVTVTV